MLQDDAHPPSGAQGAGHGSPSDALLASWRDRTIRTRGYLPGDWDAAETSRLATALAGSGDVVAASCAYATTRYRSGWSHDEVLDDLEDLCAVTPASAHQRACSAVRQTASVWIHELTVETLARPHRDPLTGLPTVGFLLVDVERLYRDPSERPEQTHLLVVAELSPELAGADRIAALLALSHQAERSLPAEAVVAALGSSGIAAVLPNTAENLGPIRSLASGPHPVRVVVEAAPPSRALLEGRLASHAAIGLEAGR